MNERKKYNTRGKISQAPGNYGSVSKKGYRRVWCTKEKRFRMEHILVWEEFNGKIPEGYQIHHIDGNKLNNDISNLKLVNALTHKRIHSGCELREDGWWKPCGKCNNLLHENDYYKYKNGYLTSYCKKCTIKQNVIDKRKRRQRKKDENK